MSEMVCVCLCLCVYYFTEYVWCVDVDVAVVSLEQGTRGRYVVSFSLSPCRLEQKVERAKGKERGYARQKTEKDKQRK